MLAESRSLVIVKTDCGKMAARPPENSSNPLPTLPLSLPQFFARDARAFGHGFELGPGDLWIADARTEAAVGARHDIFATDDLGVAHEAVGDRLRMLDNVRRMADDAGNEHFARGQFNFLPHAPLMLVARIGGFDGNRVRFHFENEVDDVSQRDVVLVRAVIAAPAGVKAHAVR